MVLINLIYGGDCLLLVLFRELSVTVATESAECSCL